jgi:hypothetical protein
MQRSQRDFEAASEIHDPLSDLSLFLSKQIKEQMKEREGGVVQKWSSYLQNKLIEKITPEFEKKFPHQRLGVHAIKKVFEKIVYYSSQIEKEAVAKDGSFNLTVLIRDNIRDYFQTKGRTDLKPHHFAHKLAMKLTDLVATMEGSRIKIDHLSRLIWSVQRHLMPGERVREAKSPYDEFDKLDRLIVKTMVEILVKSPPLSPKELGTKIEESLTELQTLPLFSSIDELTATISALLAENKQKYSAKDQEMATLFIKRHAGLCKKTSPLALWTEWTRRMVSLYQLASSLPKGVSRSDFESSNDRLINAFVAAEKHLGMSEIYEVYQIAEKTPLLEDDELLVLVWSVFKDEERLLEQLPYRVGQRIESELAHILIDNPQKSFQGVVDQAVQFFSRSKELLSIKKWEDIKGKIELWSSQGELVFRWMKIDHDHTLLKHVLKVANHRKPAHPQMATGEVIQNYLAEYPELAGYAPELRYRIEIFLKYMWYAIWAEAYESSLDRFIAWHMSLMKNEEKLKALGQKMLPLFILTAIPKEEEANEEKRKAE